MTVASFIAAQRTDHHVPTRCLAGRWTCPSRPSTSGGTASRRPGSGAGPSSTRR